MNMYIPSTFTLGYRAKMIVHAFMIELDQLDYNWYPRKLKTCETQWRACSLVISQILSEFRLEGATYKTLNNQLSKFAQNFTVGMVGFYPSNPHCCLHEETSPVTNTMLLSRATVLWPTNLNCNLRKRVTIKSTKLNDNVSNLIDHWNWNEHLALQFQKCPGRNWKHLFLMKRGREIGGKI